MRIVKVEYVLNDAIEKELDQVLAMAKDYVNPATGERHYLKYDKDQILQLAMEIGSTLHIMEQLDFMKRIFGKEKK